MVKSPKLWHACVKAQQALGSNVAMDPRLAFPYLVRERHNDFGSPEALAYKIVIWEAWGQCAWLSRRDSAYPRALLLHLGRASGRVVRPLMGVRSFFRGPFLALRRCFAAVAGRYCPTFFFPCLLLCSLCRLALRVLLDRDYFFGARSPEALFVQVLDELRQRRFPRLLPMVVERAETLRVHAQLSRHLHVRV
jgi:hypothetical protein